MIFIRRSQAFVLKLTGSLATGRNSPMYSNQQRIDSDCSIVVQITQADCCISPHHADASQQQTSSPLSLHTEDVLNLGTRLGPSPVASLSPFIEFAVSRTLTLDKFPVAHLLQSGYRYPASDSRNQPGYPD
jgi:hypothetical protein